LWAVNEQRRRNDRPPAGGYSIGGTVLLHVPNFDALPDEMGPAEAGPSEPRPRICELHLVAFGYLLRRTTRRLKQNNKEQKGQIRQMRKSTKKSKFGYGWRPDLPDTRDRAYSAPFGVLRALPRKVDLRPKCPPVVNQGTLGSCTANAIASAHYFNQKKQGAARPFQPSRLFIYYNERRMENTVPVDSGAHIRDGFKSISKEGVCPELLWKYNTAKFATKPPVIAYKDALNHQAIQYMRVQQTLGQLKGCIADGFPFVYGFTVYESFESPQVAKTGIVPLPSDGDAAMGGHAVMAVGYDDAKHFFVVQNSWSTAWGDKGYFYMPYSYLIDGDLSADFWTARTVEL
jgi:C1A family cysteine protease